MVCSCRHLLVSVCCPLVLAMGILVGCGGSQTASSDPDIALRRAVPLDAAMKQDFGAATKVSAEVAAFWSLHQGGAMLRDLWQSSAVQRLAQSPGVLMAMASMRHDPDFDELLAVIDSPTGRRILAALVQLGEQELFLTIDGEAPQQLQAMGALYQAFMWSMIEHEMSGEWGWPPFPIDRLLELRQDLAVPEVLFGARLTDPEAVQTLIDEGMAMLAPALADQQVLRYQQQAGEQWQHRLVLEGGRLVALGREFLVMMAEDMEADLSQQADLITWLSGLRWSLTVTVRDDYLLVHSGGSERLLTQWGAEASLAEAEVFNPLRALHRPGMCGVHYRSAALRSLLYSSVEDYRAAYTQIRSLLSALTVPRAVQSRLDTEVPALIDRMESWIIAPAAQAGALYRDQGLRWISVSQERDPRYDSSRPLSLPRQSTGVLLATGSRGRIDPEMIGWLMDVVDAVYGIATGIAFEQVDRGDRRTVAQIDSIMRDFGRSLAGSVREDLLPALGGPLQHSLVVDAGGHLVIPDEPGLDRFAAPRVTLALETADPQALVRGIGRISAAIEGLVRRMARLPRSQLDPAFTMPALRPQMVDGQQVYVLPVPMELGDAVMPAVAVIGSTAYITTSAPMIAALQPGGSLASTEGERPGFVEVWADVAEAGRWLTQVIEQVMHHDRHAVQRGDAAMITTHLRLLASSLASIQGLYHSGRQSGEFTIYETWLQLEDR